MPEKPNVTLPGTVEKIIPSSHPSEPEKAQISVKDGDDLYKEIRIENALQDEDGNEVALREGAEVEVTVEAHKHIKRIRRLSVRSLSRGARAATGVPCKLSTHIGLCLFRMVTKIGRGQKTRFATLADSNVCGHNPKATRVVA
jgi:hypothetical protein